MTAAADAPRPAGVKPLAFESADLVFVSYERLDLEVADAEGELKPQAFHALGLVGACTTTAITVKLYLPEEAKVQRLPPAQQKRLAQMRQVMQVADGPTGRWWVRKLGKMSTSQREFLALYSVRELPLGPVLISPNSIARAAEMPAPLLQTPVELERAMEGAYDESQLRAIRTALRGRGVTLIQGPPGTGKTRTILGILSVLLGSRSSSATRREGPPPQAPPDRDAAGVAALLAAAAPAPPPAARSPARRPPPRPRRRWPRRCGATPFPLAAATDAHLHLRGGKAEAPPEHVLVCAPSNAAIDEIVARLLHTGPGGGLLDASGRHFVPPVLRVGPNIRESLSHVSLDSLARKRQMEAGDALTYEAARSLVLVEARIVCTTLSCAGHKDFASLRFDTVIIDEAAQAVEVSTLIPLKYACRRLILVGDPNQLPATVFSERSKEHNYEQSLFERLQKGRHAVTMLQTQYRMHPHISAFPSAHFYAGAIHDAPSVVSQPPRPWHARRCLAPYVFYDVADGHAEQSSSTWYNDLEAKLAVAIIEHLLTRHGESCRRRRSA